MSRARLPAALAAALLAAAPRVAAPLDPPHDATSLVSCASCHVAHHAPGAAITLAAGNANLCQSCHVAGGLASGAALAEADQALPAPGLPAGTAASGTSHRWDSGAAGHVEAAPTNASPGAVTSAGTFTGRRAKTYVLTIVASGDAGAARFDWADGLGAGASGLVAGAGVPLDEGVSVSFANGASSPSFVAGDAFLVHVRAELAAPASAALAASLDAGRASCSTCHDVHSQANPPFDPTAPLYDGAGTGRGRHLQAIPAAADEPCRDCHRARDVAAAALGSHPVGVPIPAAGSFRTPSSLPLDTVARKVQCSTCHAVHRPAASDGNLLRLADARALCADCHTLADTATPAAHLSPTSGALWPGGQYGSTLPADPDPAHRGTCLGCHRAHGWPDLATADDYPSLLADRDAALCFTCHDGAPAADQRTDFAGTRWADAPVGAAKNVNLNTHHDVLAADQARSGARVSCADCHDPHRATATAPAAADPDPSDGRVPAAGLSWPGSDLRSEWCLDCHDGSYGPGVVAPTVPLAKVRTAWLGADEHGTVKGTTAILKSGYGWARGDVVPCTACHDPGHGTTSLFQLRGTVYAKDGVTPVPADAGCTSIAVTSLATTDRSQNGWCFCNTCHTGSMGGTKTNCFSCHYHGTRF